MVPAASAAFAAWISPFPCTRPVRPVGAMATGIRMIASRSSFDLTRSVLGILPERMIETTAMAIERAQAVLARFARSGNARLRASASFRGLNNASDELILGLYRLAKQYGTLLQTHACFSYSTHDSSIARGGLAEIERLEKLGVIDEHLLLVHAGWLEPEEVAILARRCRSCWPSESTSRSAPIMQAPALSTCRRRCGSPAAATRRSGSTRA